MVRFGLIRPSLDKAEAEDAVDKRSGGAPVVARRIGGAPRMGGLAYPLPIPISCPETVLVGDRGGGPQPGDGGGPFPFANCENEEKEGEFNAGDGRGLDARLPGRGLRGAMMPSASLGLGERPFKRGIIDRTGVAIRWNNVDGCEDVDIGIGEDDDEFE